VWSRPDGFEWRVGVVAVELSGVVGNRVTALGRGRR